MSNPLLQLDLSLFDGVELHVNYADETGQVFDKYEVFAHYDPDKSDFRGVEFVCEVWYEELAEKIAAFLAKEINKARLYVVDDCDNTTHSPIGEK
jgi:hypothetical protein